MPQKENPVHARDPRFRRFGIILPSVNTVVEDDFRLFGVDGISSHVTRVSLNATTASAQERALDDAPMAAALLADAGVDAIMFACTGASMIRGAAGTHEFGRSVKSFTDAPATTVADALVSALRALGLRTVSLFSPFDDKINDIEAAYLEASGVHVAATLGLGIRDARLCADLSPEYLLSAATPVDRVESDGIVLSCANMRGFEAVEALESAFGKPVVATNQVMLWKLLTMTGVRASVQRGGSLFSKYGA